MTAGYKLTEGSYDSAAVSDDELWSALSCVFSSKSKNNSTYKYGLLEAILDNLNNVNKNFVLSFDQIFDSFTKIYWNLIVKYKLRQTLQTQDGRVSYLEQILHHSVEKYKISSDFPFANLSSEIKSEIIQQVKTKCKKYVIGALFEDTQEIFYSFSKNNEWLKINPPTYDFLCRYKALIEKANYYEWAKFLEKVNPREQTFCLLTKLEGNF